MITLKEIFSKDELKQFVKFPFKLYKDNPYWIPPIINDEVESFNKKTNPVFEHANAKFFLAYKNNEIVGRVVAIINWLEVNDQKIRKMRFGWFDAIDDVEVTRMLLDKVIEIGKENNLEYIEGPIGFSNLDKVGVLTKGFDELGTMMSWYNYSYYKDHFEQLGLIEDKRFIESYFAFDDIDITNYARMAKIVEKRFELKPLNFTSSKQILPYVNEMFSIFDAAYSKLSSYVPISQKQIDYFKDKFISLINPEYIKFVVDKDGKLVSFSITMPSFAKALQKANGKLFPFGFLHLLNAKKHSKEVVFLLIGVLPEYQKKGVIAIIMNEFHKTYKEKGIQKAIRTAELEENHAIHLMWKNFNPKIHKKRSTYIKNIESL